VPVLKNDSDPDGDALTIISVSPTNGVASISGTNVIFTPATNFIGSATCGYGITDGFGGTNFAVITITVTNIPPTANPDFVRGTENVGLLLSPLTNDVVNTPGGVLAILSVSATNGTANVSGTNVTFIPATNFIGTATIGYKITDGIGGTNSSVITVIITNIPPTAGPDTYAITENTTNWFPVLVNDAVNTPGGSLTLLSVTTTNGSATVSGTNILFAPALNFLGTLTLNYIIIDNIGGTNSTTVTVTVTNIPPTANPDSYIVLENSTNTFAPLTNDVVNTPGGTLQIVGVNATNGTATILNGTNVVFTPANNFTGTTTLGYTVSDGIGGTNSSTISVTVLSVADLAVSKSGPATVYAATNFAYTITVTNLGPGAAANLSVTDNLPAAVSFVGATAGATLNGNQLVWTNLGSLPANTETDLTVTVTAPMDAASLTNLASAGSPTSDPNPTNNTSLPVFTSVTPIADLVIAKSGPASVSAANNFDYTISVTNFGPSSASSVMVTDALPAGVPFVIASGNGVNNSGVVTWSLGTLAAGQSSNLTLTVTAPASGSLTNIASVGSPTLDTNILNNVTPPVTTTVIPVADLGIGKSAAGSVLATSNLVYTISVTNFGPSTASSVTVTDSIPAGVTFFNADSGGANNAGTVIWNLGDLPVNFVTNVSLTVTPPVSGSLTNVATVGSPTSDPNPTNNVTPPVTTTVTPLADVVVAKSAPASVTYGSNFDYTISVTNFGPSTAGSVTVTDSLPANLVFVSASAGWTTNGNQVIWTNLGDLAAGAFTNLTLTVMPILSGSATNVATAGSPTRDPNPTNNFTPPVVTLVNPAPLIITANSTNKVYNTVLNLDTNAFTSVGLQNSETIGAVTLNSGGTPANAPVDSYAITATNAVGGTFNPANYSIVYSNGTLTVTRGVYSIAWTNPASIVYGTALSSLQNDATSTVAGSYVYNPTNGAVLPVRTNALTVVFTPADTNYAATNLSVLQVVTPAPLTVTANSTNRIYGTANPVFTATYAGFVNGENTGVLAGNPSLSTPATAGSPVGNYTIVVTNGTLTATNYAFQFVNGTLAVNPRPAILYGVRAYDGTTNVAAGILQVTNKVGADVVTVVSGTGGLSTTNVGTWPITSFGTLTLGGGSATNYTLAGASGWVTITNTTPVTNRADLVVSVTGPANVTVGDTFFYTVTVSNAGPTSALNIQVTNFMPTNLVFSSASGGGGLTNKVVRWPLISSLLNGDATNFIVTVYSTNGVTTNVPTGNPYNFIQTNLAPAIGLLTNRASAFASTFDPNTTNNSASVVYTNAQVNTLIVPGILSIFIATNTYPTNVSPNYTVTPSKTGVFIVGSNAFNPQTGLYEENVSVTNIGTVAIHSLRLYVTGLRKGVTLYNPTGTNNGQVYVEYVAPYSAPINPYPGPNNYVSFQLEFYATDFNPFTNTLSAVASSVVSVGGVTGTPVSGNVQKITDTRFQTDRFLLEFNSVPGKTYTILYGDALNTITNIAAPSIVAYANVTQWYDDGPPKTSSKPSSVGMRLYIVIQNN
jgi:large repetitive protein